MKTNAEVRRDNLRLLSKELGSIRAFADKLGKSESQVSQWINGSINSGTGRPRTMRDITAREIEEKCGKPTGWLDVVHIEGSNVEPASVGTSRVPLISYVQAGELREAADPYPVGDAEAWLLTDSDVSACAFALRINGDSMEPEFVAGDIVIIDPEVHPHPGDFVVAKDDKEGATFKKYRLCSIDGNGNEIFELVPLNGDYATVRSDQVATYIVGTMIEHRRFRKRR